MNIRIQIITLLIIGTIVGIIGIIHAIFLSLRLKKINKELNKILKEEEKN